MDVIPLLYTPSTLSLVSLSPFSYFSRSSQCFPCPVAAFYPKFYIYHPSAEQTDFERKRAMQRMLEGFEAALVDETHLGFRSGTFRRKYACANIFKCEIERR